MQRKKLGLGHPDFAKDVELMPFQMKPDILANEGFGPVGTLSPVFVSGLERALAAFPLFGGAEDDKDESPPAGSKKDATPSESTAGGDSQTEVRETEVPNLEEMTPEKINELLKSVTELSSKVTTLTQENNTYRSKDQAAERAKMGREQALEADLTDAQQTIAKMDAVIRHAAVINAIQGTKDMEWHSARHVMNELDPNGFDLDVDLENGTATVTGIEAELKRIAKECPWLVSKDRAAAPNGSSQPRNVRGSGNPPPSSGGSNDKVTKRSEMINKFPVIAHGRAG